MNRPMSEPPPFPPGSGELPSASARTYRQIVGSAVATLREAMEELDPLLGEFIDEVASRDGATAEDHRRICREASEVRRKLD